MSSRTVRVIPSSPYTLAGDSRKLPYATDEELIDAELVCAYRRDALSDRRIRFFTLDRRIRSYGSLKPYFLPQPESLESTGELDAEDFVGSIAWGFRAWLQHEAFNNRLDDGASLKYKNFKFTLLYEEEMEYLSGSLVHLNMRHNSGFLY